MTDKNQDQNPINFMDIIANPNSDRNRQIRQERSRSINKKSDTTSWRTFDVPKSMDQETKFDSSKDALKYQQNGVNNNPDPFDMDSTSLPQFGSNKLLPDNTNHENQRGFSPFGMFHASKSPRKTTTANPPVSAGTRGQRTMSPKPYVDSQQEVIRARNQQLESSELRVSTRGIGFESQEDETQAWLRQRVADKAKFQDIRTRDRRNITAPAEIQRNKEEFSSKFKRSLE